MKNKRLLFYILVNIFVSALTTLAVLILWDVGHQVQNNGLSIKPGVSARPTEVILPTLPPTNQTVLQIDNVFGTGHLDDEVVVIKKIGEGEISLAGWKLVDDQNHQYIFPNLSLNKGEVNIHTRSGTDSATDLYWSLTQAIWQTGKKVRIYDPSGYLRAEYVIP